MVQGFDNNSIITYRQTNFSSYLSICYLEKTCGIRLFSRVLFFPIDVMVDLFDRLHNTFPKLQIKGT